MESRADRSHSPGVIRLFTPVFTCERLRKISEPSSRIFFHLPLPCSRTFAMRNCVSSSLHRPFRLLFALHPRRDTAQNPCMKRHTYISLLAQVLPHTVTLPLLTYPTPGENSGTPESTVPAWAGLTDECQGTSQGRSNAQLAELGGVSCAYPPALPPPLASGEFVPSRAPSIPAMGICCSWRVVPSSFI